MSFPNVNAHLHTPWSFSAFDSVSQALDMAAKEGVKVVGINDFYSMDGYGQWSEGCASRGLYPLYNIEFIALNQEDQAAGTRVNDPSNPGRTSATRAFLTRSSLAAGRLGSLPQSGPSQTSRWRRCAPG